MLREAKTCGLLVDAAAESRVLGRDTHGSCVAPDPNGPMHESLKGAWYLAELVPKRHYNWKTKQEERRMNLSRRRTVPSRSLVHESVFLRAGEYAKRLPPDVQRVP
jgi:hypothetical protein